MMLAKMKAHRLAERCFISSAVLVPLFLAVALPSYNWDIVGYVAATHALTTGDPKTIHELTFADLKAAVPTDIFKELTGESLAPGMHKPYRDNVLRDPAALSEALPLYTIRILYCCAILFLSRTAGISLPVATYVVSGGAIGLLIAMTHIVSLRLMPRSCLFIWPPLMLAFGAHMTARLSSPDAVAALEPIPKPAESRE